MALVVATGVGAFLWAIGGYLGLSNNVGRSPKIVEKIIGHLGNLFSSKMRPRRVGADEVTGVRRADATVGIFVFFWKNLPVPPE